MKAVRAARLVASPELIAAGEYTPEGGALAMEQLLSLPEPPTAVLVANVASAIGALHAAHRLGAWVPDDISVIGVHDLPLAGYLVPPLTTVRMPLESLGARAVELLLTRTPDDDVREVVSDPVELVQRESTAQPPRR